MPTYRIVYGDPEQSSVRPYPEAHMDTPGCSSPRSRHCFTSGGFSPLFQIHRAGRTPSGEVKDIGPLRTPAGPRAREEVGTDTPTV